MTGFRLENSFGYLINLSAQRLKYELHQTFQERGYDVTPEQWVVLNRLWEQDGLSQVELAERTFKDKPSTTRILNLLEKKSLVVRRPDEKDGRVLRVYLTASGWEIKEQLVSCADAVLQKASRDFTKEEVAQFKLSLNKLLRNIE
ncbi:MAG TPA: MarR family transcriptional regulator [Anaerolineales bacterium]|nr:MarR family transcriptional regulator [Anaerolineales bacterium]